MRDEPGGAPRPASAQGQLLGAVAEIQADLEAIERDVALCVERNFGARQVAGDVIERQLLDRIDGLLATAAQPGPLLGLRQAAEQVQRRLEAIDQQLFRRIRAEIRSGLYRLNELRELIAETAGTSVSDGGPASRGGYDSLDLLINGLLGTTSPPVAERELEPDMVYYQKTPARVLCELIEQANLTQADLFYDLGSGLGHAPILVSLLSAAQARGVEFEPAYCAYAQACAADLRLSRVAFINADARDVAYADGTVFFMYTPFRGRMLEAVLAKLRAEAYGRVIRLFTFGPCTATVAQQPWLARVDQNAPRLYRLAEFRSRQP